MLTDVIAEVILATGGFAATNMENVAVLVGLFCARTENAAAVRLGFAAGSLLLLAFSLAPLFVADLVPVQYLGYLGVIPIAFGIRELTRKSAPAGNRNGSSDQPQPTLARVTFSATALMVANGADTVAVFAPLLAETEPQGVWVISLGFMMTALALAALAGRACTHPGLSAPLQRYGPRIAPYVMIGIGVYILLNTGTDVMAD